MITLLQYFGPWMNHPDATPAKQANAQRLLDAVNSLMAYAEEHGIEFKINPSTDSQVSGTRLGGFRPILSTTGAARSSHKEGLAVDIYDPDDEIDKWCLDNLDRLEKVGIYLEHPDYTTTWSHWTIRKPGSGNRVFYP